MTTQRCQNKLVRYLNNAKISDRKSTKSLLESIDMLSVDQLNAQIKLTEIWKAVNQVNCTVKINKSSVEENERISFGNPMTFTCDRTRSQKCYQIK